MNMRENCSHLLITVNILNFISPSLDLCPVVDSRTEVNEAGGERNKNNDLYILAWKLVFRMKKLNLLSLTIVYLS